MRKKAAFPIPTQLEKQPKPNISKTKRWDEELLEHPILIKKQKMDNCWQVLFGEKKFEGIRIPPARTHFSNFQAIVE